MLFARYFLPGRAGRRCVGATAAERLATQRLSARARTEAAAAAAETETEAKTFPPAADVLPAALLPAAAAAVAQGGNTLQKA